MSFAAGRLRSKGTFGLSLVQYRRIRSVAETWNMTRALELGKLDVPSGRVVWDSILHTTHLPWYGVGVERVLFDSALSRFLNVWFSSLTGNRELPSQETSANYYGWAPYVPA